MTDVPAQPQIDVLRAEFPDFEISRQTIADREFYVAEPSHDAVQPRHAQAESVDRLREKLKAAAAPDIDTSRPAIPRVWDYFLGGKDNFTVDRSQGKAIYSVYPEIGELARDSRQFQQRAVTFAAREGVRQFIDIGCGLPTVPNTHETARAVVPEAWVAYVDNDPVVLTHARNLLATQDGVLVIEGDAEYPEEIMYDSRLRRACDFDQPICLVLTMLLHFYPPQKCRQIVGSLVGCLPHQSYLVISMTHAEGELAERGRALYRSTSDVYFHSRADIEGFLRGTALIDPGIVPAHQWRNPVPAERPDDAHIWVAVAQKG